MSSSATPPRMRSAWPRRIVLLVLATVALMPAAAEGATVAGPAGLRLAKLPASVQCPPGRLKVSLRFTKAAARKGVRAVRIEIVLPLGERGGVETRRRVKARRGKRKRVTLTVPCGVTFRVRVTALRRGGKSLGRKSFKLTARAAPGLPAPSEPTGPPPGAQTQLPGASTTWSAVVDTRRSGPRDGQTCVQVTGTTADDRRTSASQFCGLLSEDPFVARTREIADPADGANRLVLAGAANLDTVASVSVVSPNGTQQLALSPPHETPGSGGGFIAVWDATATGVGQLTLLVALKDGSTQTHPAPQSINLRDVNGGRI